MKIEEARLEILKILIPGASRIGITEPVKLIEKAKEFEEYVLGEQIKAAEAKPLEPPKKAKKAVKN